MIGMHAAHSSGTPVALAAALAVAATYVWAAQRLRRRGDTWSGWRILSFVVGTWPSTW
jgi:cytochrome c oxidase assembly factor CtaG